MKASHSLSLSRSPLPVRSSSCQTFNARGTTRNERRSKNNQSETLKYDKERIYPSSSSPTFLSLAPPLSLSVMERRKRRVELTEEEKMALVKAAAWAWYQRGVGQEGMPERELDSPRPRRQLLPSRFKLEAAAAAYRLTRGDAVRFLPSVAPDGRSAEANGRGTRGETNSLPRLMGSRKKQMSGFWVKHAVGVCGVPDVALATTRAPAGRRKSSGVAPALI